MKNKIYYLVFGIILIISCANEPTTISNDESNSNENQICTNGERKCNSSEVLLCKNGVWDFLRDCDDSKKICQDGECISLNNNFSDDDDTNQFDDDDDNNDNDDNNNDNNDDDDNDNDNDNEPECTADSDCPTDYHCNVILEICIHNDDRCNPDPCDPEGGYCDETDGTCICQNEFMEQDCSSCIFGYSGYPNCKSLTHDGFAYIPTGSFRMGATQFEIDHNDLPTYTDPSHNVNVNEFQLMKFEVTNKQYVDFLNEVSGDCNGHNCIAAEGMISYTGAGENWFVNDFEDCFESGTVEINEKLPAVTATWYGAKAYCEYYGYRLPSEAEWEYAARAETTTVYYWGNDLTLGYIYANYSESADCLSPLQKPGLLATNNWELYDMIGNAKEWVEDCSHNQNSNGYIDAPNTGGVWEGGDCSKRMARGNNRFNTHDQPPSYQWLHISFREAITIDYPRAVAGFRCAADIERN